VKTPKARTIALSFVFVFIFSLHIEANWEENIEGSIFITRVMRRDTFVFLSNHFYLKAGVVPDGKTGYKAVSKLLTARKHPPFLC
jgi:hypothetical protein